MKAKPRWMKGLLKATAQETPAPPFARQVKKLQRATASKSV